MSIVFVTDTITCHKKVILFALQSRYPVYWRFFFAGCLCPSCFVTNFFGHKGHEEGRRSTHRRRYHANETFSEIVPLCLKITLMCVPPFVSMLKLPPKSSVRPCSNYIPIDAPILESKSVGSPRPLSAILNMICESEI